MIEGLLLAAGSSARYGRNKLLEPLADGVPLGLQSARHLLTALPRSIAVVAPDNQGLADLLRQEGMRVVTNPMADQGMGASLACAVRAASEQADGWVVALADMPWIVPNTIAEIAACLQQGNLLVAPQYHGRRGHPVGFSARFRSELLGLNGDVGARQLLEDNADRLLLLTVNDPGIFRDVDRPDDLIDSVAE